jgi:hypothetical protein
VIGPADFESPLAKAFECLWRGNLVDEVEVDIEDGGALGLLSDYVLVPDFCEEGSWLSHRVLVYRNKEFQDWLGQREERAFLVSIDPDELPTDD